MNGHVKVKDTTPVFDVRHICTYLLLTRVNVQKRYFWLVRWVSKSLISAVSEQTAELERDLKAAKDEIKSLKG
jgi:hypothetical protein